MSTTKNEVTLRSATADDAIFIEGWLSDDENIRFMPGLADKRARAKENWEYFLKSEKNQHVYIVESNDKKPLGICLLYNFQRDISSIFTGTVVPAKGLSGSGAASAAHNMLLEVAFNQLKVRNVHSKVYENNTTAINRMVQMGYKEVARKSDIYSEKYDYLGNQVVLRVTPETWTESKH